VGEEKETMTDPKLRSNIREFSEIPGVIFSQLYESFPILRDIHPDEVARTLGLSPDGKMPSGRMFSDVLARTISWLDSEGFIHGAGLLPRQRVVLTAKALSAMSAVPPNLSRPLGSELADAASHASSETGKNKIVELVGNFVGSVLGSATKTIGGA
jgi:hypothetical protein